MEKSFYQSSVEDISMGSSGLSGPNGFVHALPDDILQFQEEDYTV